MTKICKCALCRNPFVLGVNGAYLKYDSPEGEWGCDSCLHIERDVNGEAWYDEETFQERENVETGETIILAREHVFNV